MSSATAVNQTACFVAPSDAKQKVVPDLGNLADQYVLVDKKTLAAAKLAALPPSGMLADSKEAPLPLLRTMSGAVNTAMKSKLQNLRLTIPFSIAFSSAVSGIVSSVVAVSPDSNASEWAAVTGLYDEYRLRGFKVKYAIPAYTPAPGAAGLGPDAALSVLAFDPVDSSALTAVRNGCEYSQHKLLASSPALVAATTGSSNAKFAFPGMHNLDVKVQPVLSTAFNSTGAAISTPGEWTNVLNSGTNLPQGWLKVYMTTDFTTVSTALTGIVYCDVEFRSRR